MVSEKEKSRLENMYAYERKLKEKGYKYIAGIDEAGRGPLAGPVVAACCIIRDDFFIEGINDSKKLTPLKRQKIYNEVLKQPSIIYSVSIVDAETIDEINILQATLLAMKQSFFNMSVRPDHTLIDGIHKPKEIENATLIVKGDSLSISIALASIIAKQTRDDIMEKYHQKYPEYSFAKHKGYGTKQHRDAIFRYGPCCIHRKSFEPIKSLIG